jgi:outer membrane protein assembly factor BamB
VNPPAQSPSLGRVRTASLLLPPLGLWLLWRNRQIGLGRKLLGTLGLALYSLIYAAGIVFLLVTYGGLQIEFRGGRVPYLTFSKTLPDYDALETSRARQQQAPGIVAATNLPGAGSTYWNGFRGPERDGHYDEQPILTAWPREGLRRLWRQPVGGGYASFAVAGGRAFTIEQRRQQEVVTAYDLETGRELWAQVWDAEFKETLGGDGPRATPAWDEGRVYALGAMGEFRCLDAVSGRLLWRKNILTESGAHNLTYGVSASPLVVDDRVIVAPGGRPGKSVVAYDKRSGQPVWTSLDDSAAYSSPMLVSLAGQRQLLVATKHRVVGLEVDRGKLLWEFPWVVLEGNCNIAQPVLLSSNRFLLSAGYGTGCVAVEVDRSAAGFVARERWRNKYLKNKFTSSVFWQGHVYGLDEDILTCLDAATGRRQWKDGRYGYGQLLLASGHLVVLCGNGDLALVKATPERHEELARFPAIHGKTWNHPAIAEGRLLVRNAAEMACFDLRLRK